MSTLLRCHIGARFVYMLILDWGIGHSLEGRVQWPFGSENGRPEMHTKLHDGNRMFGRDSHESKESQKQSRKILF